ncbi:Similar to RNA 3' acc. no. Q08096 [Pyronema omphalodes CBS 100304]|uniref:Similar to RNA 3&apos acc. no. Q08096 n=1 Tax=Pyronema omphalodes (strain CBS 100304) TaxID=1076935 RepID=U4LQ02_PYROM|nr:Similar to RNA 3' acc. no. Q08096 [Pyronema omphalodes CBS 100304]
MTTPVKFTTHANLRHRLVLATLTGTPLHITQIRANSMTPGLTSSEVALLRLLDNITNGSFFEISLAGTTFVYKPGLITANNGKPIHFTIPETCTRGVTYYLEVLALVAPFSKAAFSVTLDGGVITAATEEDMSVDTFRTCYLALFQKFGMERNIDLRIVKRSAGPHGAGEVHFVHGFQTRVARTLHLQTPGRVKRIRGVAYGIARPQIVPADYGKEGALEKAGGNNKGRANGRTRKVGVGFGISLVAETGTGCIYAADATANPAEPAEDVGKRCAYMLLEEIQMGGCVGRTAEMAAMTMMMMGQEGDVGRLVIGKETIDETLISQLRDMKKIIGTEVAMKEAPGEGNVLVSILGRGVGNVGRKLA